MPYEILLQHVSIVPCLCVFGISHFGLYYLYSSTNKDFFAISRLLAEDKVLKLDPDNALKVAFAKLYQTVKKDIGDIRQEKIDMCDIHAVGKMAGKLSAERDTFMKEKEEYLESIQSKLRKLLFEEIALEDARKMYN